MAQTAVLVVVEGGGVQPGGVLEGTAVLHLAAPDDVRFERLELQLAGIERVVMRPDTSCGGDGDEVPVTDSHVCLDERSLLAAGPLKHGAYKFPWSYRLPPNLPPSFSFCGHQPPAEASIKYSVQLLCHMQEVPPRQPLQHRAAFRVENPQPHPHPHAGGMPPSSLPSPASATAAAAAAAAAPVSAERTHAVRARGCFAGPAEVTLGLSCCGSARPGDALSVRVKVHNATSQRLTSVQLQLMHVMNAGVGPGAGGSSQQGGPSLTAKQSTTLQPVAAKGSFAGDIILPIPSDVPAPVKATLVHCSYIVCLAVSAAGGRSPACLALPLHIVCDAHEAPRMDSVAAPPPPIPAGWPSTTFPTAHLPDGATATFAAASTAAAPAARGSRNKLLGQQLGGGRSKVFDNPVFTAEPPGAASGAALQALSTPPKGATTPCGSGSNSLTRGANDYRAASASPDHPGGSGRYVAMSSSISSPGQGHHAQAEQQQEEQMLGGRAALGAPAGPDDTNSGLTASACASPTALVPSGCSGSGGVAKVVVGSLAVDVDASAASPVRGAGLDEAGSAAASPAWTATA